MPGISERMGMLNMINNNCVLTGGGMIIVREKTVVFHFRFHGEVKTMKTALSEKYDSSRSRTGGKHTFSEVVDFDGFQGATMRR